MSFARSNRPLALILLGVAALTAPLAAAEPVRDNTSLKFVPADASFYYSRLRLRQQYEAVVKSQAWAKLLEMPVIKMAMDLAKSTPPAEVREGASGVQDFFAAAENKELYDLLLELISDEVFLYGDAGFTELYESMQKVTRLMNDAQIEALKQGVEPNEVLNRKILEVVIPELDKWKSPDLVFGFKIKDVKRAEAQLARLEKLLAEQLEKEAPHVKARLVREKIGGSEFLALKLDGTLIPWDQLREQAKTDKEQLEKIIEKVKQKTLVIHIGIHAGYLLASIGDTDEHLRKLGQGPLLIDRPELAPVRKHGDKSFTSLSFVSEKFLKNASAVDVQIDNYVMLIEKFLPESELDPELQKELLTDVRALAVDLKKMVPKPGTHMGFGFLSSRGTESYSYDWSEQFYLDGSQRLSILDHVGGNPLMFSAARTKYAPESYDTGVKWLRRAVYWGERLALPQLPPDQLAIYQKLRAELQPLALRLDQAMKTMWIPAFKDGQSAFVLDAKLTSAKWFEQMPAASRPLPMLEIGTVHGVSNADLVKRASNEFFAIAQQTANVLHDAFPDAIAKVELTAPTTRQFPEGTIFYYSPPKEWGLDPQIAPNAALSADTLALSLVPKFSLRLLQKTPLQKDGPLAQVDRPLAAASYVDFAGLLDVLSVWIDYGFEQSGMLTAAAGVDNVDAAAAKSAQDQVRTSLQFLQCLRSVSSVTYFENGAVVTHSDWHFVDRK